MLCMCQCIESLDSHNVGVCPFTGLHASLSVAPGKVPESPEREPQESVSKTQLQGKRQKSAKEERLTRKYNNYTS